MCFSCIADEARSLVASYQDSERPTLDGCCPCCGNRNTLDESHTILSVARYNLLEVINALKSAQINSHETDMTKCPLQPYADILDQQNYGTKFRLQRVVHKHVNSIQAGFKEFKPDIYVFNEEPSVQELSTSKGNIKTGDEYFDETPVFQAKGFKSNLFKESNKIIDSEVMQQPPELPPEPLPSLPGPVWVEGPRFNSARESSEISLTEDPSEVLVHATLVELSPPIPEYCIAYAKPIVTFREKYKWPMFGLLLASIIGTVIILAVKLPKTIRNNRLTTMALFISNQNHFEDLGVPQKLALHWILGENNTQYDPINHRYQLSQRYMLAAFYYGTYGGNWSERRNMLSSDDECKWYENSLSCSQNGSVVSIELGKSP